MRNVLNRKKKQISDFSDFYFLSYGHFLVIFVTSSPQFSMNFHNESKKKIGNLISHSFQHIEPMFIIHKNQIKTEGGGLHIVSWEIPGKGNTTIIFGFNLDLIKNVSTTVKTSHVDHFKMPAKMSTDLNSSKMIKID